MSPAAPSKAWIAGNNRLARTRSSVILPNETAVPSRKKSGVRRSGARHPVAPKSEAQVEIDPACEYNRLTGRDASEDASPGKNLAALFALNDWFDQTFEGLIRDLDDPEVLEGRPAPWSPIPPIEAWSREPLKWWAEQHELGMVPEGLAKLMPREVLLDALADPPLAFSKAMFEVHRSLLLVAHHAGADFAIVTEAVKQALRAHPRDVDRSGAVDAASLSSDLMTTIVNEARAYTGRIRKLVEQPRAAGAPPDRVERAFYLLLCKTLRSFPVPEHLALLAAVAGFETIRDQRQFRSSVRTWRTRIGRYPQSFT
jgi:hypothetical protein